MLIMEEKTKYLRLYDDLCSAEEMVCNVLDDMRNSVLEDCLTALYPEEEDEDIRKLLSQTFRPITKYKSNLEIIKGRLLIQDRKAREPPEGVVDLDYFVEDMLKGWETIKSEAPKEEESEEEEQQEGEEKTLDDNSLFQGDEGLSDDTVPDDVFVSIVDIAKREEDYDK